MGNVFCYALPITHYSLQKLMIDEAYKHAISVLHDCISDIGFKASALDTGYHEVWGRDSMITLLGAMQTDDADLHKAARASLDTLSKYQTELGLIPNNVDVENNEPEYRSYMDGTIWYIIGSHTYYTRTQDSEFLKNHAQSIKKAFTWLAYQDVDHSGLISTQEAGDWMDLFPVRGNVLYDNALYYGAIQAGVSLGAKTADCKVSYVSEKFAQQLKGAIQQKLWIHEAHGRMLAGLEQAEKCIKNNRRLEEERIRLAQDCVNLVWRPYFLAFRGFRQVGDWFDSLGNMLAILFGVADDEQAKLILDFAGQVGISQPYPIKAVYPPIYPGEQDWRDYFKIGNLNLPHHYHNGGIWPFIGGFYVAALVKAGRMDEAQRVLLELARANQKGKRYEWEFNEWMHGVTGNPMGKEKQAWSAAMYIFGYHTVKNGKVDLLG